MPTPQIAAPRPTTALDDTERELAVLRAVVESVTAWDAFQQGAELLLGELAGALGQMAGALWLPHGDTLEARAIWSMPSVNGEALERALSAQRVPPGSGLAGYAWRRREAVDGASPEVSRRDGLPQELDPTIALPCSDREEVLGVVELYSTAPTQLSHHLMEVLVGAGEALGRFLARRRGELGLSPLSAREVEILVLAGDGFTVREIAEKLTISPATVKTHLEHIYKKLGVRDRVAAVAYGLRTKIIE
jgi:DNA-binding CsgD family transcriptional regulator